ncbi:hypothetical protein [Rhizobium sp. K102]|uniref:hypothetical protein n=1 Tax=Rhizobium sp. K102 TaxID=2918527 RepID=UPI001EFB56D6|nr:hypothetical protein [Rhizobium sp. K102]ULR46880.1 hypothetical protein MHI61_21015 [Rhizobium sp. K102]
MANVTQESSYCGLCIAFVIGKHLGNFIINHGFADRLLAHIRAPYSSFQIGGRLADVPIMFSVAVESIINLGQLLFKLLLMNCGHDNAASQAFPAAAW